MDTKKPDTEDNEENYMSTGMCLGAAAGSVGMSILAFSGQIAWGSMSVAAGLILGMLIGMMIPKKKRPIVEGDACIDPPETEKGVESNG